MKIHFLSDIHTEISMVPHKAPDFADVIVLAGDIGDSINGLKWSKDTFKEKEIIYIPGNHEYYRGDLGDNIEMEIAAKKLGIHFLNNKTVVINNVRFIGSTLWTDFNNWNKEDVNKSHELMNDYKKIKIIKWLQNKKNKENLNKLNIFLQNKKTNTEYLYPEVILLMHIQSKQWLTHQLETPFKGKTVVVTHHAPSYNSTEEEMNKNKISLKSSYASDLSKLIAKNNENIDLWIHGHIHRPADYNIHNTRIVANPRGYPIYGGEAYSTKSGILDDFKAKLIIDL